MVVPGAWLPLVPGLAGAGLLLAGRRLGWERSAFGAGSLVAVAGGWGFVPLVLWLASALASLSGWPMVLDAALDLCGHGAGGCDGGVCIVDGGKMRADIEVGFVHGDALDERGELMEDRHDAGGLCAVGLHAGAHEDALGAEPCGGA